MALRFHGAERIKKRLIVPDKIPYDTYAQNPIVWSRGKGILSEVDKIDSSDIRRLSASEKSCFRGEGRVKSLVSMI